MILSSLDTSTAEISDLPHEIGYSWIKEKLKYIYQSKIWSYDKCEEKNKKNPHTHSPIYKLLSFPRHKSKTYCSK